MRLFIIAAVAASAIAMPAAAQSFTSPEASISGGFSLFDDGTEGFNGSSVTARGSLRFHQYVGVEADVSYGLVESDIDGVDIKMNSNVGVHVVGYWPVAENADLIARVGYGETEFEVSYGGSSTSRTYSGPTFGLGGQYFMDDKNGVRFDVTRHEYEDLEGGFDSFSMMYVRNF
ncbi:porin family protein [Brevundimonas lenta]|uniref:Outer membrane protein beta-barrel domain-containing protein n=1 Tax=Brevundimonas lenta TaxID=424796 RepID=A0A7W6NNH6_9CAUL|nr:porin family protein [Brevundimonas lenta]MBB4082365.1 hypothetical protein [Brevundimonas lenta]